MHLLVQVQILFLVLHLGREAVSAVHVEATVVINVTMLRHAVPQSTILGLAHHLRVALQQVLEAVVELRLVDLPHIDPDLQRAMQALLLIHVHNVSSTTSPQ
jgi:hypothetical protein